MLKHMYTRFKEFALVGAFVLTSIYYLSVYGISKVVA